MSNPRLTLPRAVAPAALALALVVVLSLAARSAAAGPGQTHRALLPLIVGRPGFAIAPVGHGFNQATAITHAGDDRLFVAEREGRVKIIHPDGRITVFLDIRHRVLSSRGEYGLYDLAFHPGYADPASPGYGLFYASFSSGTDGRLVDVDLTVSRFLVSADPNLAGAASEAILFTEPQTSDMHKAGSMDFDPRDNRLYVGVGEDFKNLIAQDGASPKGKILRLAVDLVPRDARGRTAVPVEIWAAGLRNPWRIDVDPLGERILIGDVGSAHWEEVNLAPLAAPGANFGWPCLEGPLVKPEFAQAAACANPARFVAPIHAYAHYDADRCVIISGKVYRPSFNPGDGRFVFADMCSREVFTLGQDGAGVWRRSLLGVADTNLIITIGEDRHGQQYLGTVAESAPIYRLTIP